MKKVELDRRNAAFRKSSFSLLVTVLVPPLLRSVSPPFPLSFSVFFPLPWSLLFCHVSLNHNLTSLNVKNAKLHGKDDYQAVYHPHAIPHAMKENVISRTLKPTRKQIEGGFLGTLASIGIPSVARRRA